MIDPRNLFGGGGTTPYPQSPIVTFLRNLFQVKQFQEQRRERETDRANQQADMEQRRAIMRAQLAQHESALKQQQDAAKRRGTTIESLYPQAPPEFHGRTIGELEDLGLLPRATADPSVGALQSVQRAQTLAGITGQPQTVTGQTLQTAFPGLQGPSPAPGQGVAGTALPVDTTIQPPTLPANQRLVTIDIGGQKFTVPEAQAAQISSQFARQQPPKPEEPKMAVTINGQTYNLSHAQAAQLAFQQQRQGEKVQMVTITDPVSGKTITVPATSLPSFFPRKAPGDEGVEGRAIARETRAEERRATQELSSLRARTNSAYQRARSLRSAAEKIDSPTAKRSAVAKADQAEAEWNALAGELATKEATRSGAAGAKTGEQRPAGGFDQLPDPKQYAGKIVKDTQTGKRYQSNGVKWVPVP